MNDKKIHKEIAKIILMGIMPTIFFFSGHKIYIFYSLLGSIGLGFATLCAIWLMWMHSDDNEDIFDDSVDEPKDFLGIMKYSIMKGLSGTPITILLLIPQFFCLLIIAKHA